MYQREVQMSWLTLVGAYVVQNIVCRLPLENAYDLIFLTGNKQLAKMAPLILLHVTIQDSQDYNYLKRLESGHKTVFQSIQSLYLTWSSNNDKIFAMPTNLTRLESLSDKITIVDQNQMPNLNHLKAFGAVNLNTSLQQNLESFGANNAPNELQFLTNVKTLLLPHDIFLRGLMCDHQWSTVEKLTLFNTEGRLLPDSFEQPLQSLKHLSARFITMFECVGTAFANLDRLSLSFSYAEDYFKFFAQQNMAQFKCLSVLKCAIVEYIHILVDIPQLPPNLHELILPGVKDATINMDHPTLQRITTGTNEWERKDTSSPWLELQEALINQEMPLDFLTRRFKLIRNLFVKPNKAPAAVSKHFVSLLFNFRRDIFCQVWRVIGHQFFWWESLRLECNDYLEAIPVEKYDIFVLNIFRQFMIRTNTIPSPLEGSVVLEKMVHWFTSNQPIFDKKFLSHMATIAIIMSPAYARESLEPFLGYSLLLPSYVQKSFYSALSSREALKENHLSLLLDLCTNPEAMQAQCNGIENSRWFDLYPLWRIVAMTEAQFCKSLGISFELRHVKGSSPSLKNEKYRLDIRFYQTMMIQYHLPGMTDTLQLKGNLKHDSIAIVAFATRAGIRFDNSIARQ